MCVIIRIDYFFKVFLVGKGVFMWEFLFINDFEIGIMDEVIIKSNY